MAVILVVDDEPSLRSLAQAILEHRGYRVLAANGGPQALQISHAEPGPIDLLVTDLVMPGMDGAELGRQLRALRPAMRILYITALAVAHLAGHTIVPNRIVLDPGVPILVKPFSIEALEQKVQDVLEHASAPAQTPNTTSRRPGLLASSDESQP